MTTTHWRARYGAMISAMAEVAVRKMMEDGGMRRYYLHYLPAKGKADGVFAMSADHNTPPQGFIAASTDPLPRHMTPPQLAVWIGALNLPVIGHD